MNAKQRALGYVRVLPGVDMGDVVCLSGDMARFAEHEGFTLAEVFIEKEPARTTALEAMTRYCQRHDIRNVVVPTSEHLNTLPMLATLAKELLQEEIGGQVWIVASTNEEVSCPPTP
ncbi:MULTISPECIES: hypothetical protein [unclassified Streptomyces]|uniref:hypothetical protein n=1 Tax=unclassified Streptomyces TaxID=2593676 RepID=UPI002253A19C|nr:MULTISPECIES: hypothetical protein [unclassified Streptomyces]MCX5063771.1 hypothetical protein [Streptomyces sp. NBC_00452]MCX5294171.1 hypothetical protein [Streptomyces sp. NBC_00183]